MIPNYDIDMCHTHVTASWIDANYGKAMEDCYNDILQKASCHF